MSKPKPDGGPAYPRPSSQARDGNGNSFWPCAYEGMSYRQWLIGMAVGNPDLSQQHSGTTWHNSHAKDVIKLADAIIAALAEESETNNE